MRTTLRLDDRLLDEVKAIAAKTGKTIASVIEDALRESLARRRGHARRRRARLPTYKGKGLQPGVDLDDSSALLDVLDRS
jgi:hypothetical protein